MKDKDIHYNLSTDDGHGVLTIDELRARQNAGDSKEEFKKFRKTWRRLFPSMPYVRLLSRGAEAERIMAKMFLTEPGMEAAGTIHFEPGALHIEEQGGTTETAEKILKNVRLTIGNKFAGGPSLGILERYFEKNRDRIGSVIVMVTNNEAAGQPVDIENIIKLRQLMRDFDLKVPLILDAARIWDNAQLLLERRPELGYWNIYQIVNRFVAYADGLVMSAKKNVVADTGGIIAFKEVPHKRYLDELLGKITKEDDKN